MEAPDDWLARPLQASRALRLGEARLRVESGADLVGRRGEAAAEQVVEGGRLRSLPTASAATARPPSMA